MEILGEEQRMREMQKLIFARQNVQNLINARVAIMALCAAIFRNPAGIHFGVWRPKCKTCENFRFCAGNSVLQWIWKSRREKNMQDIIIALLAFYAVWSARKIMRLSAALHILVWMLGDILAEEPQDL